MNAQAIVQPNPSIGGRQERWQQRDCQRLPRLRTVAAESARSRPAYGPAGRAAASRAVVFEEGSARLLEL